MNKFPINFDIQLVNHKYNNIHHNNNINNNKYITYYYKNNIINIYNHKTQILAYSPISPVEETKSVIYHSNIVRYIILLFYTFIIMLYYII